MASLSCSVVQPNSRGWVDYLAHEKPSAEEDSIAARVKAFHARIKTSPPPPTAVTLPNRHGWVGYFAEVEFPPPALLEAMDGGIIGVLGQVHPDMMLSEDAMYALKQIVRLTCEALVKNLAVGGHVDLTPYPYDGSVHPLSFLFATTVTAKGVRSAVRDVFEGELVEHAERFACMEITKFTTGGDPKLVISQELISVYLNAVRFKAPGAEVFTPMRFDALSLLYMVSALDCLVAEVLELGGNVARDAREGCDNNFRMFRKDKYGGGTMTLCHINMAVINDTEMSIMGQRCRWRTDAQTPEELRLLELRCCAIGQPRVMRTLALLVGREDDGDVYEGCKTLNFLGKVMYDYEYTPGGLVSKAWNTIFENEAKTQLESHEAKWKILQKIIQNAKIVRKLRFKSLLLPRMDWLRPAPDTLAKKFVKGYILTLIHSGVNCNDWAYFCDPEDMPQGHSNWKEEILTKFDVKTIERNDWPYILKDEDSCHEIFEYCESNTKLIAEIVTDIGNLSPNLESITLCGVPVDPDWSEQAEVENADDIVPAIKALATTNPNLIAFDMSTVPTNDNVVNEFAVAFPQLTFFSATNGVFGENISDAALDALRLSHPGITITIRGM